MSAIVTRLMQPGALRVEFQPIVKVRPTGLELYGVEALARGPRGTTMERPDVLFEYARLKGVETAIDLLCITEAFTSWTQLPGHPLLSINIHGATLAGVHDFAGRILAEAASFGVAPDRLMFEVLEHRAPWAIATFVSTLDELRAAGVRIAVDDLGSGASNFRMVVDCHPDHLKIDRHVVLGCGQDRWRRAVLESITTLSRSCGAFPIAEGVETSEDLEALLDVGIDTVQGWLYAASTPAPELAGTPLFNIPAPKQAKGHGK